MIKVGIIGADSADGGELLRILINHPEVDIVSLYAPTMSGRQVSSCHHGFIGERRMTFTDKINLSKVDALFLADDSAICRDILARLSEWPEIRVIDLSPGRLSASMTEKFEYGLSEINRKGLVRGARYAVVPSAIASLSLIALFPLASNLLLTSDLEIIVSAPQDLVDDIDVKLIIDEISCQLKKTQISFDGNVSIKLMANSSCRVMKVKTFLKCPLDLCEIEKIYEDLYDDHNFTFSSLSDVGGEEVEGTQKSVVSFSKTGPALLEMACVGDCHMRGGAGDAVHVLNLLFSLHEKVGLHLKPVAYGRNDNGSSAVTSWFA